MDEQAWLGSGAGPMVSLQFIALLQIITIFRFCF